MDTLVYKHFDLKRINLDKQMQEELNKFKRELAARGAYHSSHSGHGQGDIMANYCKLRLNALLDSYEEVDRIQPGFILKNEKTIRDEVNDIFKSEYNTFEKTLVKIFDDLKMKRNFNYYDDLKNETDTKLDIMIESRKRMQPEKTEGSNHQEPEYKIHDEEFKCDDPKDTSRLYKCFVLMPIGDPKKNLAEYNNNTMVFNKIIKPCVENSKYQIQCYHADDELFTESGDIQKQIFDPIYNDEIVIVDLRRKNTNVIYEACMRHYSGKRSILVCSNFDDNFFHNDRYRAYPYSIDGDSNQRFYQQIQSAIESIIKNPNKPDNPIIDFLNSNPEAVKGISEEERWYKDEGGSVYNVLLLLKQAELYLNVRNSMKFSVDPKRSELKSYLRAYAKSILQHSANKIYKEEIPLKDELQNIAKSLDNLGRSQAHIGQNNFDKDSKECIDLIDTLIKNNIQKWKKLGVYLVDFKQLLSEIKEKLEILVVRFSEIGNDIFLVQNEPEITSSCEVFAKELNNFNLNEIFNFKDDLHKELKQMSLDLMELYLPPYNDGGQSMRKYCDNFKNVTKNLDNLLNQAESHG